MTCSCPKCNAQIEIDLSKIPESGTFSSCTECKGRFWINKENYARMALKKEGNIYCDQCGKELGGKIVCSDCGIMYPDYYLVQASKPPRRQIEKPDLFSGFALRPTRHNYTSDYNYTRSSTEKSSAWAPSFNLKRIGVVAIVLLLAASLGYYYHIKQLEKQFARDYMRTLYSIKIGTDLSLNTCAKISTAWESNGQNSVPRISVDDESRLNRVKEVTDTFMQKLNDPPSKFASNKDKLANLYEIYAKANALAVAPSGTISSFEGAAAKTQSDFNSAVAALKENMPSTLAKELQLAKTKYKGLQNI